MNATATEVKRQSILHCLDEEFGRKLEDLVHLTGFAPGFITRQLQILKHEGKSYFDKETDAYYKMPPAQVVVNGVEIPSYARPAGTSVFKYRDDAAMWERVALLRKMKARLIEEYHPLLDAVIADYEWMLRKDAEDDD